VRVPAVPLAALARAGRTALPLGLRRVARAVRCHVRDRHLAHSTHAATQWRRTPHGDAGRVELPAVHPRSVARWSVVRGRGPERRAGDGRMAAWGAVAGGPVAGAARLQADAPALAY